MKNLLFNRNLSILACMVLAMMFAFTSCSKDDIATADATQDIYANASLKKDLITQGIEESKDHNFTFEISSNSEEILNAFNKESIKFKFLTEAEIETHKEEQALLAEMGIPEDDNIEEREEKPSGDTFVTISLKGIANTSELYDELPTYNLQLSPEVVEVIREANATTIFDFDSGIQQSLSMDVNGPIEDRACNPYCTLWNKNKEILVKGDCANIWTKADIYYASYGQSWPINHLTSLHFKCRAIVNVCEKHPSKWIRRVTLRQDVIVSVTGFSNYCGGTPNFTKQELNNCSGYYPYGC